MQTVFCMLFNCKGLRILPQNQRFNMLIAFGLSVVARVVARWLPCHTEAEFLTVKEQYGLRSKDFVLGPALVLTLCIQGFFQGQVQSRRILFTCIVADIAKAYQSVLRPELMAVLEKCGIPPRFSKHHQRSHSTRTLSSEV